MDPRATPLINFVAAGLCGAGCFCAGSSAVVKHQVSSLLTPESLPLTRFQHINRTTFVFSAATPVALAVAASEAISILRDTPSILSTLQENIQTFWSVLGRLGYVTVPSRHASPIIHIQVLSSHPMRPASLKQMANPASYWSDRACSRVPPDLPVF